MNDEQQSAAPSWVLLKDRKPQHRERVIIRLATGYEMHAEYRVNEMPYSLLNTKGSGFLTESGWMLGVDAWIPEESAAPESQPEPIRCSQQNGQTVSDGAGHQGCCAARKVLEEVQTWFAKPYRPLTVGLMASNMEARITAALAAPCECATLWWAIRAKDKQILEFTDHATDVEAERDRLREEVKQLQAAVELHKGAAEELRAQLAAKDALLVEARNSLSGNRNG